MTTARNSGRAFTGPALHEVCFPLGGIGTGCIGLTGVGGLAEWQIFGRPDQDSFNPHSGFAIWAKAAGAKPVARILERPVLPPYGRHQRSEDGQFWPGGGLGNATLPGLPHVEDVVFRNQFPCAHLDYHDRALPVEVSLDAWSPFVPMDADASGIPAALFEFRISNPGRRQVRVSLAASVRNPIPSTAVDGPRNRAWDADGVRGVLFDHPGHQDGDPLHGSVLLATPWPDGFRRTCWRRLNWFDGIQEWWESFSRRGTLDEVVYATPRPSPGADQATIGLQAVLPPGGSVVLPVWIAWSFPTMEYTLAAVDAAGRENGPAGTHPRWRHHYATAFPDTPAVASHLRAHLPHLRQRTFAFRDALLGTTADPLLRDAIQSNLAILRSPTMLRLSDGTLYGYEGSHRGVGSCPGSCMHVWNYNQAIPALFPELERGMRSAEFTHSFSPTGSGALAFRIAVPFAAPTGPVRHAAADAQFGVIIRTYAAWRASGDLGWLRSLWPGVRTALKFAWRWWDPERCGVISGPHHNTYDIEFHGPDPMATGYYLAALEAGARIAEAMQDGDTARLYRRVAGAGRRAMDNGLFNGAWYEQRIDPEAWRSAEFPAEPQVQPVPGRTDRDPDYQFGRGCLSDQLVGIWLGEIAGLGPQLDPARVVRTLNSIHRWNFRADLRMHSTAQRCFALNDEAGLLLCTWPRGGRPAFPFVYCDEIWPGIEYQVASHLIRHGRVDAGTEIVRAVRRRHDGVRRNPFNEFECGSWYVRSLASWALVWALSGADHDAIEGRLAFAPRRSRGRFRSFWSSQGTWGTVSIGARSAELQVAHGDLDLRRFTVGWPADCRVASALDGVPLEDGRGGLSLAEAVRLRAGSTLRLRQRR